MSMNIQKWAPWNWLKKEEESHPVPVQMQKRHSANLPSLYGRNPLWELHREMDRLFDLAFQGTGFPRMGLPANMPDIWKPSIDIKEGKKAYDISVEIPGVDEKDVTLSIADGALTISGEKKQEREDKDGNYYSVERSYGSFKRVLALPADAKEDDIEANFKNGVLTVTVPRKQLSKAESDIKKIDIHKAA